MVIIAHLSIPDDFFDFYDRVPQTQTQANSIYFVMKVEIRMIQKEVTPD
jgi:hypothetical protein